MAADKDEALRLLRGLNFGKRVAEEEQEELSRYFVETVPWTRLLNDDVDLIYGPKGSGKSALYALLISKKSDLFFRGRFIIPAEDPLSEPAFRHLDTAVDLSENQLKVLWKLYFLVLISKRLNEAWEGGYSGKQLRRKLEQARIISHDAGFSGQVIRLIDVLRNTSIESLEAALELDTVTGRSSATLRASPKAIAAEPWTRLETSMTQLFSHASAALEEAGRDAWIALDRLDSAFMDSPEMEVRALRALFRVYQDMRAVKRVRLKIFLRTDVWSRITEKGFTEASHLTRSETISWTREGLLDLVMKRVVASPAIRQHLGVENGDLTILAKDTAFHHVVPRQMETGAKRPRTFDWLISRVRDGTNQSEPRELIHWLTRAKDAQIGIALRDASWATSPLIGRAAIRDALPEVSRARLEQTLFAECPDVRPWVLRLKGTRPEYTAVWLAKTWRVDSDECQRRIQRLVDVGFFDQTAWTSQSKCQLPLLYRPALETQSPSPARRPAPPRRSHDAS